MSEKGWLTIDEWASDVGTDEGCVRIVEESVKALGGLDIIVSNAVRISLSLDHGWLLTLMNRIGMDEDGYL